LRGSIQKNTFVHALSELEYMSAIKHGSLQIDSGFIDFCFGGFLCGCEAADREEGQNGEEYGFHDFC